ncbi:uncharacterized protein LOC101237981 isoform X2 [Hydra vulgaris]|uniref:Uncharacterized protein LOC101237981 isoform X2 n=1 Tax=Hydra vulgaris TaxID=6087 RepID=A0ABM4B711_HYDVU
MKILKEVVLLIFIFLFFFITFVFLTASLFGDSWWVSNSNTNARVGLFRVCTAILFHTSSALSCSIREHALQLDKDYKDFDIAAILNIVALIICLCGTITLMILVFFPVVLWLPYKIFILSVMSNIITLTMMIFVEVRINSKIDDFVGETMVKGWTFKIAYCALVTGFILAVSSGVFLRLKLKQKLERGFLIEHLVPNDVSKIFAEELMNAKTEYKSHLSKTSTNIPGTEQLKYFADCSNLNTMPQQPEKMRAVYRGSNYFAERRRMMELNADLHVNSMP